MLDRKVELRRVVGFGFGARRLFGERRGIGGRMKDNSRCRWMPDASL